MEPQLFLKSEQDNTPYMRMMLLKINITFGRAKCSVGGGCTHGAWRVQRNG